MAKGQGKSSLARRTILNWRAEIVYGVLRRRWFKGRLNKEMELPMITMMLGVYLAAERGEPLSKKESMQEIGAEDPRTARKYFALGEELGLLRTESDPSDRRKELLLPTPLLVELLEQELEHFGEEPDGELGANFSFPIVVRVKEVDYLKRGITDRALGHHERAITHFTEAIKQDPKHAQAFVNRGLCYAALGKIDNAIVDLRRAVQLNAKDAEAAAALKRLEKDQKAQK